MIVTLSAPSESPENVEKPVSALKTSKYSSKPQPSAQEAKKPPAPKPIHQHAFQRVIVDGSVDFGKASLAAYGDDNPKKLHTDLTDLMKNINICDPKAIINHKNPLDIIAIGPEGHKVPTNLTNLSNYFLGINAKHLNAKADNEEGDALASLRPGKKEQGKSKMAYFSFYLSCDVPPKQIVEQIGLEWSRYGNFMRVKELQHINTSTPIVCHNLFIHSSKSIVQSELNHCFKTIQQELRDSYSFDNDIPFEVAHGKIPDFGLRLNVPNIPHQHKGNVNKMPKNLQICKKNFHIESADEDRECLKKLVAGGKKLGVFKEILGAHVHLTETVDWESPLGDLKRAVKFHKDSTNYLQCQYDCVRGARFLGSVMANFQTGHSVVSRVRL
jgi:hypothetical protein